jgi:hypothetical protein
MMTTAAATALLPSHYDPNQLFDTLISRLNLKNDAGLSRALNVARPVIASIRQGVLGIGAWMLLRMAEISQLSITDLRQLMGDQRTKLRVLAARVNWRGWNQ